MSVQYRNAFDIFLLNFHRIIDLALLCNEHFFVHYYFNDSRTLDCTQQCTGDIFFYDDSRIYVSK